MKKSNAQTAAAVVALMAGLAAATNAHAGWSFATTSTSTGLGTTFSSTTGTYNVNTSQNLAGTGSDKTITQVIGWSAANGGTPAAGLIGTQTSEVGGNGATGGVPNVTGADGFAAGATWARSSSNNVVNGVSSPVNPVVLFGSGVGIQSDGNVAPDHAIDNGPSTNAAGVITGLGNTEGLFLQFSGAVSLNSINLGYTYQDADVSVFALTLPGTGSLGTSLSSMTAGGYTLVGNYADLKSGDNNINTNNVTSSYWFISAYNTAYGTGAGLTQGNDYFKIAGVSAGASCATGTAGCNVAVNATPEPTSLALVVIAGLSMFGVSRRQKTARAA